MSLDLVFEVLCEQMPVRTMDIALGYVGQNVCEGLEKNGISFSNAKTFVTPNRISLVLYDIDKCIADSVKEIKGPRVCSDKQAIDGFLRKMGRSSVEELEIRSIDSVDFYYATAVEQENGNLYDAVREVLQRMIDKFPLHKKMKWGSGVGEWVRPVLNVACLLGGSVLQVRLAGCVANDTTYGNIRLARVPHKITSAEGYISFLEEHYVVLDQDIRRRKILEKIDNEISGSGLQFDRNDKILDEMCGMLECPNVLVGSIDKEFMGIPFEVIYCVLTKHQRCIALYDEERRIVKFAAVVSTVNARVIASHEMVVRARLKDAVFLIEKDKKRGLENYIDDLENVIFKKELGTLREKVNRISVLAKYASVWVPRAYLLSVERAALLAKADLASLIVKEFPELQGKMGRYYAQQNGEEHDVCVAIEEHYLPVGASDRVPVSPIGVAVSIADKVDTLVGLYATEKVTGSSDPFALRRTAITLLKVIKESVISIPLDLIVSKSVYLYLCDAKKDKKIKSAFNGINIETMTESILDFCYDRLKIILKEEGYDRDIIGCVVGTYHDIILVRKKVKVIGAYIKTDEGREVLTSFRRINNILPKGMLENARDKRIKNKCSEKLCESPAEIELYRQAKISEGVINSLMKANNFGDAMVALHCLSPYINEFLETVRVHEDENSEVYKNRLSLAVWLVRIYNMVIDFGKIPKEV